MRKFQRICDIKAEYPGVGAWILEPPAGSRIILTPREPEPEGRFCIVGIIEK